MAKISCPGCDKQYNVPASAAGQTATCKACGKKFRLGTSQSNLAAKQESKKPATSSQAAVSAAPIADEKDGFWDEAVKQPEPVRPPADRPSAVGKSVRDNSSRDSSKPKKKKKRGGIKWGADWGKVVGGLATFFIAGIVTLGLLVATGYLYFWPAGIAVVGLITALSGLMGEEGVW